MNVRRKTAGLLAAVGVVAGSLLATAAPAQAYGALDVRYARVDTGNCARLGGTLSVTASTYGCYLYDSVDDTYFVKDPGGEAVKIELRSGGTFVAKVEFHPYDQKLWIYDDANDGDTVYVRLYTARQGWSAVYYAIGTEEKDDKHVIDLSAWLNEGEDVLVQVTDNSDATDEITRIWARA
jgi:hypothetical protein